MFDIALIGSPREPEIVRLKASLTQFGHPPLIVNTAEFPQHCRLTLDDAFWSYENNNLNDIKAFFLRSQHCSELMDKLEGSQPPRNNIGITALREKDSMLGSLLRCLAVQGTPVLNPLETLLCQYYKIATLERLRRAGVPVPPMIATNDADAVNAFANKYKQIVCKPLAGGAVAIRLAADGICEQFYALLRIAPVILQARIYGSDVRAYILNKQVIAAASTMTDHVDFRTSDQQFQPTALTDEEASAVIHAARLAALTFAGIDFKRTSDGRCFVLDINPAPMFAGFERITGLDIAGPIAKYLVSISSGHAPS